MTAHSPSLAGAAAACLATVLLSGLPAAAAIKTVTNLNDSGAGSLRDTIAAASSGDTIKFALTGTITLTSGTLQFSKNLTIQGPGAPEFLVVTRSAAAGTPAFGVFRIDAGTSTISGITISNGRTGGGGGGIQNTASLTVGNCIFADNVATDNGGGAIQNFTGSLTVQNCAFTGNRAEKNPFSNNPPDDGGAILNEAYDGSVSDGNATLAVYSSTFSNNHSDLNGGAIGSVQYSLFGVGSGVGVATTTVEGCTFTGNSSLLSGAGIFGTGHSTLTVRSSTFNGNTSTGDGGGIYVFDALTLEGCSFELNKATKTGAQGGGVSVGGPPAVVRKCLFAGNEAGGGGGISCFAQMDMENCTFHGNNARELSNFRYGGGAINSNGGVPFSMTACTLSGNTSAKGGTAIHQSGSSGINMRNTILDGATPLIVRVDGTVSSNGYNLCRDDGGGFLTFTGDQSNTSVLLDPLGPQDHGGLTKTIAPLSISPALDAGKAFGLTTDQRGVQRPLELLAWPNAAGGDASDIGAFESSDPLQGGPVITVTTLADHDDGIAGAGDCTLREAIVRANALGNGPTITFLDGLAGTVSLDRNLGPLNVTSGVHIVGPGARSMTVSGGGYIRVFSFAPGSGSGGGSSIAGLTIRDGSATGGNVGASNMGGGILNEGNLTLTDCFLDHHVTLGETGASGGSPGGSGRGAGLFNSGVLTLTRCTLTGCVAGGGAGTDNPASAGHGGRGGDGLGGAVFNDANAVLTINNCTIYGNTAGGGRGGNSRFGGFGGHGTGGAVHNLGSMTVTGATISGNNGGGGFGGTGIGPGNDGSPGDGNGGVTGGGITNHLRGTLCAANTATGYTVAPDVFGSFSSGGFNLLGSADGSTGFPSTDIKGTNAAPVNPLLGPLQNNGGQTNTMLPLAGSPAIDKGTAFSLTTDQRGAARPLDGPGIPNAVGGDGSDIGSVEADVPQVGPSFNVTTLDDRDDGTASVLDCTLREALRVTNAAPGPNTITFAPGLSGTITMTPALGTMVISSPLTILGPGARQISLTGPGTFRAFQVTSGPSVISGLTIRNGVAYSPDLIAPAMGGGILNQAALTLSDCTVRDCLSVGNVGVTPGAAGLPAYGGGISNMAGGALTIRRCTFSGNAAMGGDASLEPQPETGGGGTGGECGGGAVFNDSGCTLIIETCTYFNNRASGGRGGRGDGGGPMAINGAGGVAKGGGILNAGTMTLTSATLRSNEADGGLGAFGPGLPGAQGAGFGGGMMALSATAANTVRNTICAANTIVGGPSDVNGAFTSGGFNVIGTRTHSAGFTATGDQGGTDAALLNPLLGPPQNNGGQTDTMTPLTGSPALDRGNSFGLSGDQRGQSRPYDDPSVANGPGSDGSDSGAVEARPPYSGPPYFVSIIRSEPVIQFTVQGDPLASYQLQSSFVPDTGYANAGPAAQSDGAGIVAFTDSGPLPFRRFYKVVRVP